MSRYPVIARFLILLSTAFFLSHATAENHKDMIFRCAIGKNREMTVFKSATLDQNDIELTYESKGKTGTEMRISEKAPIKEFKKFSYNHYSRYQTNYIRINFISSDYEYSVYSDYDANLPIKEERGVIVTKRSTGDETKIKCSTSDIDKLEEMSAILNCNQNSALGCQ
ncbi:MAG: hypothetical protein PGN19_02735 [Pseudomonas oryzihabitans]